MQAASKSNNGRLEIIKASLAMRVVEGVLREEKNGGGIESGRKGSKAMKCSGYRTKRRDQSLFYRLYSLGKL